MLRPRTFNPSISIATNRSDAAALVRSCPHDCGDGSTMDPNMTTRIALADDDPDSRQILIRLLTKLGYEVCFAAEDGEQLVADGLNQPVDVVLLDLDMPNLDGLETAEQVAQRGIPVILVSGHPDLNLVVVDREPVLLALSKPVTATALREAVQHARASQS